MSWAEQEALREVLDAQTQNRDLLDGQILCQIHYVQQAVNPDTGEAATDPRAVRAPLTHGPNDPGNPLGLSSEGMCYQCWQELRSGGYYPCPIHGIQPAAKRESDGEQCCAACGKTAREVSAEVQSRLEARAPAIREQIQKEDRAWIESMERVQDDGLERQQGVLENEEGPWEGPAAGAGTPSVGAGADGPDHRIRPAGSGLDRGVHGGGRQGDGNTRTGSLLHRPS